ncbi:MULTISPECIES: DUF418 domain-containing protein [Myxococcus]|uniref:DUF418 domain-containing protein n=1 Tax=Myxococcus xanthus TaxID=34 RepID=A0AAE6G029_MYXXA|nr:MULTISPECIES: DUF418 domain-containing protein [Myxococcus]QDE68221.1 hypothetical protein BHS09_15220 [Myxococcus xanthus]QDE75498.1 hypothetical protein BHS08_15235 [Myxococcus xanthus]QDE82801.1 hypothetical protein BHS07_15260 [Myxococcus xanthus]QDE97073.1 hypothetical protein BHS05_15145 [Myxococcus xanthus]QDF04619.1 hypothetical protein BHS04_15605 [Myxococcus xanthus]
MPNVPSSVASAPLAEARPVEAGERLELLDALRGFALFGILISNVQMWFSGRVFLSREQFEASIANASLLDTITRYAFEVLVSGKFMTLFAFLFGLGFAVQLGRAEARGGGFVPLYARRLTVLLVVGVLHLFLLWYGDILSSYALMGFGLLLLRRRSDRTLLIIAAVLVLVWPLLMTLLWRLPQLLADSPEAGAAVMAAAREKSTAIHTRMLTAITGGSWWDVTKTSAGFYRDEFFTMMLAGLLTCLGRFALGLWAGRRGIFQDVPAHLGFFRRLLGWGLVAAVVGSVPGVVVTVLMQKKVLTPETMPVWLPLGLAPLRNLAQVGLAGVYLAGITLLFQRATWQRALGLLAPAGRMALTNYLSQTVISLLIFYGYGLGQVGKRGPFACVVICVGIFCVQVLWSHLWLSRFRFGPVEWAWRSLTYGKAQPMRRAVSDTPPAPLTA